MLFAKNLSISVSGKKIIKDFSYHFLQGKIYAIMGPNGSGKSTLSFGLMGHPDYRTKGKIIFEKKDISKMTADKRARLGLFMSFQTPLTIPGVNVFQLLKAALGTKIDPLSLKKDLDLKARELNLDAGFLNRSLNDGFSGGEKKKMEVIQAVLLNPKLLIFDEIDTGVDVDSLKDISTFLNNHRQDKTYIIITHYNRILRYLRPDEVLVIKQGNLVKVGSYGLAEQIEANGYE